MLKTGVATTALVWASMSMAQAAEMPTREQMWQMIQQQQQEIQALKKMMGATTKSLEVNSQKIAETDSKVEATGAAVEQVMAGGASASQNKTSIGGYGELHYNGGKKGDDQIDFHRFVLFFGHEFTDRIRFFSELEIEHALSGDGKPGEVELEQAFVEFDLNKQTQARAGVMLVPVGILNEVHEPNTFYGVERNNVEKNIIPTTWWEAGLGLSGQFGEGFSYDLMAHSGLNVGDDYKIRGGRQKVAKATAEDGAITARLKYTGIPGVELGATAQYQADLRQGQDADSVDATLFEVHADIERELGNAGTFGLRALYARWDLSGAGAEALGRDEQVGWYVEPSYKINLGNEGAVGVFARYSRWDNEAGDNTASAYRQTTIGVNYWPIDNVVFKLDYVFDDFDNAAKEDDTINLGVGYQF
ncbi:MAG: porin [Kordiimonas sp.]|nr:porin [Kordiimonas sp.]